MKSTDLSNILISSFDYPLADDRIASFPLAERDMSKLLVYRNGAISQTIFSQLDQFLKPENLLIFNDTRVVQARLKFNKSTGAEIEIFCLEPIDPPDYFLNFQQKKSVIWKCIAGNLKKWKNEILRKPLSNKNGNFHLEAELVEKFQSHIYVKFSWDLPEVTFSNILEILGETPLPPYIKRGVVESDKNRYQTVYSKFDGSVAAPTAGLHFTGSVLDKLALKGILTENITLHVGAGTFKPVQSEKIADHEMHTEHFFITKQTLVNIIRNINNLIPVGTTSLRTLESLYWLGNKNLSADVDLHVSQWEPYHSDNLIPPEDSLRNLLHYMESKQLDKIHVSTQIMIVPGYDIRMAKGIITNFHQPKSSLLLLIAAFIGNDWQQVYKYAMENDFRFLSYGDSSLLFKNHF